VRRAPALVAGWALAIALIAVFTSLGFWQLGRAAQKHRTIERATTVLEQRQPVPLSAALEPLRARGYDWAQGRGGFAARPPVLLDNQQRGGRAGVRVYRVFYPDDGGELLVDLGWLPWPGDRRLPKIPPPPMGPGQDSRLELRGLLAPPPSAGLELGPAMAARSDVPLGGVRVWLATRLELDAVDREIGHPSFAFAPRVLRLDPALPIGFERDLELLPNTLPPEKHRGYAVQWFGLALAALVTASILTFRSLRR
jgi:surfeit locus 1 family protein